MLLPALNKCNGEKRKKKFSQKIQFETANVGRKKESFHLNSNSTHGNGTPSYMRTKLGAV